MCASVSAHILALATLNVILVVRQVMEILESQIAFDTLPQLTVFIALSTPNETHIRKIRKTHTHDVGE